MPTGPLASRTFRRLFAAQIVALVGTGLTTIGLILLAYDLASGDAGVVVGVALALKMAAYVVVAPVVSGLVQRLPRRRVLVTLDLVRAAVVCSLPFVTEVWQVYVLIAALSAAAAGFTPMFQATIPDVLVDEREFTQALSLSRLAYELEGLVSPALAALVLGFASVGGLFVGTGVAFLCSAAFVCSVALPQPRATDEPQHPWRRVTQGIRRYLATPRLRGLLALNLAAAAASAMIIVNTVVYVRDVHGLDEADVAWALGASAVGSMLVALALPRLLDRVPDRRAMLAGGSVLAAGLVLATLPSGFTGLLVIWFVLGVGLALVQTPAGRLVHRSAAPGEGPALFAAQFSLSHACWLITYPLAGVLGSALGLAATAAVLAALTGAAVVAAMLMWPGRTRPGA